MLEYLLHVDVTLAVAIGVLLILLSAVPRWANQFMLGMLTGLTASATVSLVATMVVAMVRAYRVSHH